jgi:hypothetical protein
MHRSALTSLKWDAIDADRFALRKRIVIEQTRTLLGAARTAS